MLALAAVCVSSALALDPRKSLTQYSRTIWTQERGLPQDTIRAITQTKDGYLWLGTDEGLARFDGYEFVVFNKSNGNLPDNSITALAAANDGGLWIGTANGLTQFHDGRFQTFALKQGLPDTAITALHVDREGALWVVAGVYLSRYQDGRFTTFKPNVDIPVSSARALCEDANHDLWVAGFSRVVRRTQGTFVTMIQADALDGMVVLSIAADRDGNIWIGGNHGIIRRSSDGALQRYGLRDGLPDTSVRALWVDHDGNIWAGTNNGMARLQGSRFVTSAQDNPEDGDGIRCLFEDREGDLWIGANGGLSRWRNDIFMVYGKPEGLPSDATNVVFQDRERRIWIGLNDLGMMLLSGAESRHYTTKDGLPDNDIFQIREGRPGELLVATRSGVTRMRNGKFQTYQPPDPLARKAVFDAIEDPQGALWLATPAGLSVVRGRQFQNVIEGGPLLIDFVVTLSQGQDGGIWAGTYGKGLWRVKGDERRHYSTADGLSSDQIRSLYEDSQGTLWIGTFGGGLNALRDGKFLHYGARDGLLSDNIGKVFDDGESLWLSTTRGICRIAKSQLMEFDARKRTRLQPEDFGVEDGLRSAQCAPAYPTAGGGIRSTDGRLWFTTSRGLAVLNPGARKQPSLSPAAHLVQMTANGDSVDLAPRRAAGAGNRTPANPLHRHSPERAGAGPILLPPGRFGFGLDRRRRTPRHQLQQPASRALQIQRAGGVARRAGQRAVVRVRNAPAVLGNRVVPRPVRGCAARRGLVRLSTPAAPDPVAVQHRFGRTCAVGARNPRYAGAGLRGHFFAIGRRGHVHADGRHAGSLVPRHGPAHGAPQSDGGAAQRDGPARVGSGWAGPGCRN